jgi:hypothetical protein
MIDSLQFGRVMGCFAYGTYSFFLRVETKIPFTEHPLCAIGRRLNDRVSV